MEIKDIIKFEPIDLTQIILTVAILLIVIYAFKNQLNGFFESLQKRPITVTMSGAETTIELDAPVTPERVDQSIANPEGNQDETRNWEETVSNVDNIEGFAKLGISDLYEKLSALGENDMGVINYQVNDPGKFYFNDKSMLKYLSIASEKVRYLAFYDDSNFAGTIKIQTAISGLASERYEFKNFGEKLKNGQWKDFPGLLTREKALSKIPSIKELHDYLIRNNLDEAPLVQNNTLTGFMNFKSVSSELYAQATGQ